MPDINYRIGNLTAVDNKLYFSMTTVVIGSRTGNQLWVSDGTIAGTSMIVDINANSYNYSSGISHIIAYKEKILFIAYHFFSPELFVTDGSLPGTLILKSFMNPQDISMLLVNNNLYFTAGSPSFTATQLWKSDATQQGTSLVDGNIPQIQSYEQIDLKNLNDVVYFAVQNTLYSFNTKDATEVNVVTTINTAHPSNIDQLTPANNNSLFFTSFDSTNRQQLWYSSGAAGGTVLLKQLDSAGSNIEELFAEGDSIYFSCNSNNLGYELWTSDGTIGGTTLVKDINPGVKSSSPEGFARVNGTLLFSATNYITGKELWKTNGTGEGTSLLKDINTTTTQASGPQDIQPASNGNLLFTATDADSSAFWISDGLAKGTQKISSIRQNLPFYKNTGTFKLVPFKNNCYFLGNVENNMLPLYKTNGTAAGTMLAQNFTDSTANGMTITLTPINIVASGKLLFINVGHYLNNGDNGLWAYDGDRSPQLLKSFYAGLNDAAIFCTLGNNLLFTTVYSNTYAGLDLWTSDGTETGTKFIKTLSVDSYPSSISEIYKNKVFFSLNYNYTYNLWVSDGTSKGTSILKKVAIETAFPHRMTVCNSLLFFTAADSATGAELWMTDGTAGGTKIVKDINRGAGSSGIERLVAVNNILYFIANDGVHGFELWKSDGTFDGTTMVKDITSGSASSILDNLVSYNGILYFTQKGLLWQSDGTEAGTFAVKDDGLEGVGKINWIEVGKNTVYLSAYDYQYGDELYSNAASTTLAKTLVSFTGTLVQNNSLLTWKTTNDGNDSYFILQRSLNGTVYDNVGKIMATKNGSGGETYNFTDADVNVLAANVLYYRLQLVNKSGVSTFSNTIKFNIGDDDISIVPNPAHGLAYIRSAAMVDNAIITVTDMAGHVVLDMKRNLLPGGLWPLNISSLVAGTYNVTVYTGTLKLKKVKLVVQ